MTSAPTDRDIGQYLGMVGRWAWVLFGLYALVFATIAMIAGIPAVGVPVTVVSLACIMMAALLVASPSSTPMPRRRTIVIAVLCLVAVDVMLAELPTRLGFESLEAWQLGAINFILFVLELRARIVAAWAVALVILVVVAVWSVVVTGMPWLGLQLTYGNAVSLAAGTVFAIGLQRTARQIFAQRDAERIRAGEEAARSAGDAHRAAELAEVRALAGPVLQRIANGEAVDRRDAIALEAALRDRIRGRGLAVEPLASALRRARERDVDALLLDDLGDVVLTADQTARVVRWCAEHVDALRGARVTIRLVSVGDGAVVSIADADGIMGELAVPRESEDPSARRRGAAALDT